MSQPTRYDRPNKAWHCGLEEEGCPCAVGPNAKGRCPGLGECRPVRSGDRWVCNRSPQRGGPCEETDGGPTPDGQCCQTRRCRPRRSLRVLRGRWLRGVALFGVGALMMLLGAGERNLLLKPGELTSHHAQVLRTAGADRCAACHPGGSADASAWIGDAWRGDGGQGDGGTGHAGVSQSALCLECHQSLAAGTAEPLLAHGLPAGALDRKGRGNVELVSAALGSLDPLGAPAHGRSHDDPLACAACHQEHHGEGHDLRAMTDARCQACHAEQFNRFAGDHPEFRLWPVGRRTRIAFNHASHSAQHYVKANEPFDCRVCHTEDARGDLTARPDYQAACASCHEADLVRSFADGLPLLTLPMLDTATLADAGRPVDGWPAVADGDFDGDLPPLMKLLLAADPRASGAMRRLGEDFSFFDVDPDDPEQLADAATLAGAIRSLLDDVQEEGHAGIEYRLRKLLDGKDTATPLADFAGRLPVELIDRLQAEWFGDATPPETFDAVEDRRTGGGWELDDRSLSLRYRPTGHDDPFVKAWLDAIAALPAEQVALRDACLAKFTRPGAPGGCFTCHTVDVAGDGSLTINWRGRDRLAEPRGFTRFTHRPHLTQPELADCTACHQLDPTADLSPRAAGFDPGRYTSEFVALTKAACADCHRPHAAGDRCTQCHNYHVDARW